MSKVNIGKSGLKFFYYITVRDNEGNTRKYVYNVFRSIIKKYNAKYYGVLAENPYPHVHAVIITDRYVDYRDAWKLVPDGVHFDAKCLNGKTVKDLKRVIAYIGSHEGFLYIREMSTLKRLLTSLNRIFHAHPTSCRMRKGREVREWS